ncbi:MAG: metallophosphoesterase [Geminicoccaceae bacterium]
MRFIGMVIAWLTMVAPVTTLICWLFEQPVGSWLAKSLLLAPVVFIGLWWTIQNADLKLRWLVMQYFGWGAVLLPLTIVGMIAAIWIPPKLVGLVVLPAWLMLGAIGVFAATRVAERFLTFDHALLDRPYKLVQLSDVHVGSRSAKFLHRAVEQALSHSPDALLLTGDLIDASAVRPEDLKALGKVPCPIYFAIGNHERYIDLDAVIAMVEAHGVDLLRSQAMIQGRLQIIGIDDADDPDQVSGHLPEIALSDEHYRILLYHRPDGWPFARQAGIDLMLAGHTHGGQIWPFNHVVKQRFKHLIGLFSRDDQHLYVSPGTGCWGPIMRLGTRAEMTVIDLVPAPAARTASTS